MGTGLRELSRSAWTSIIGWSGLVVLASIAVSVIVTTAIMQVLSGGLSAPGLGAAILLPVILGGPIVFYHMIRLHQLRLANQKLQVLASTDWLTDCLNRRSFTNRVVALLDTATGGALLVIDADHFKMVNDYFGHDCGDEALQLMARTIKASVRDGDLVGRIGGEEFGVFLKEASLDNATMTAERIRRSVATASFTPDGTDHQLSVSIGGAHFDSRISFTDLFRIADQRLYEAKQSGRNTAQLARASDHEGTRPTRRPTPINWAEAG